MNSRVRITVTFACLASLLAMLIMAASPRRADAAAVIDIGRGDTLFFLTPAETKAMVRQLARPTDKLCGVPGGGLVNKLIKALNRLCALHKAGNSIAFLRAKTWLQMAANAGHCGSFVLDDAAWRSPKIRAASAYVAGVWTTHIATALGESTTFRSNKHPNDELSLLCNEWAAPRRVRATPRQEVRPTPTRTSPNSGPSRPPATPPPFVGGRGPGLGVS